MEDLEFKVRELAQRIRHANRVVFLTGAGISTPSGIPDFRGMDSHKKLLRSLSAQDFKGNALEAYHALWPFVQSVLSAKPNFAHVCAAQLLKKRVIEAIITQNVDSLFTIAGAFTVRELHGSIYRGYCCTCRKPFDMYPIWHEFAKTGCIEQSSCCHTYIRPDIVLFGEKIAADVWEHAHRLARASDLMVVIGSSLEVAPAGFLPELSKEIAIVNCGATALDHKASLKIDANIIDVFITLEQVLSEKEIL